MTEKSVALFSSLGVLAALIIVFVISRFLPESPKPSDYDSVSSIMLTDIEEQKLRSVAVQRVDGGFNFELDEDGNWILSDLPFRLNSDEVKRVTGMLSSIESGEIISRGLDRNRLPEFGFDSPAARIVVTDKAGDSEVVEVGSGSPVSGQRYARREDSYDVVFLPPAVTEIVFMDGGDFRDRTLPMPNLDEIERLEFRRKGRVFQMVSSEEPNPYVSSANYYVVTKPWQGKHYLDEGNFRTRIREEAPPPTTVLTYLDNENPRSAKFGLADEKADMLYISDRNSTVLHLILGASDGEGNRYARLGDRNESLFKLSESELGFLDTEPFHLTSKFVFLGSIERVARVRIEVDKEAWILTRIERGETESIKDDLFLVDDTEITFEEFSSLFQKLIGISREGQIQEEHIRLEPEIRITITNSKTGVDPLLISYWSYDNVYYQVGMDTEEPEFLVGRYQVQKLINHLMALS